MNCPVRPYTEKIVSVTHPRLVRLPCPDRSALMSRLRSPKNNHNSTTETDASQQIDASFLRSQAGYNARRAALPIVGLVEHRIAAYELKVVELSVLSLLAHNTGLTSRHVCAALSIMPPNLVGLVAALERRQLIERRPHPSDGRAMGLYLTAVGRKLTTEVERIIEQAELDATARLTAVERKTLIALLQKVYDGN